jgi:hypothetical protein
MFPTPAPPKNFKLVIFLFRTGFFCKFISFGGDFEREQIDLFFDLGLEQLFYELLLFSRLWEPFEPSFRWLLVEIWEFVKGIMALSNPSMNLALLRFFVVFEPIQILKTHKN